MSLPKNIDCGTVLFSRSCTVRQVEQGVSDTKHGGRYNDLVCCGIAAENARHLANRGAISERGAAEFVDGDYGNK
jgi:hypothetical protein